MNLDFVNNDYNRCILSKYSLYYHTDINKGICRLNNNLFDKLNIKIGWILEINLLIDNFDDNINISYSVLCTAWPDSKQELFNNESVVIVDDIVKLKDSYINFDNYENKQIRYKIINIYPPRIVNSIYFKSNEILPINDRTSLAFQLCGLAITDKAAIKISNNNNITITKVSNTKYGVIRSNSLFIQDKLTNEQTSSVNNNFISCTNAVYEIIRQIVIPSCCTSKPNKCLLNGMLLAGPPGTGKTFAVKAVKEICQSYCKINIHEVNISNLLIDKNPMKTLDMIFAKFYNKIKSHDLLSNDLSNNQLAITPNSKSKSLLSNISPINLSKDFDKNSNSYIKYKLDESNIVIREIDIYVLDEIDSLGKSNNHNEIQSAIKSFICSWFDEVNTENSNKSCFLIGTTNRPQDIDPCLRRGGRFDKEITVTTTKEDRRIISFKLLKVIYANTLDKELHELSDKIAESTGGYVAADLVALISKTEELYKSLNNIELFDVSKWFIAINEASKIILPSSLRGITVKIPTLTYDDVIGCEEAKISLRRILSIVDPNKTELRKRFNITSMGGALLYGPPGNSKTRLVMASAAEHNLPVISLSSADIYSAYVGDAEAEIRKAFRTARQASPCIIFFDELDAIVTNRGDTSSNSNSSNVESRVLATLLNEMDGISGGIIDEDVIVLAATNRIDSIDKALLRKGRFQHLLYIPLLSLENSHQLVKYFSKIFNLSSEITDKLLDRVYYGMSGADVENICKEEKMIEIRGMINNNR